jgi:hypothetical protein
MEPPPVRNSKRAMIRPRLTNNERKEINEYGLLVPSKNSKNYEPNLNSHTTLWNAGTLPGTRPFNYRNQAKANTKTAWNQYLEKRAKAEANASGSNTRRNKNNKSNKKNTRRTNNFKNDPRIKLGF